jgi:hypothetical protein
VRTGRCWERLPAPPGPETLEEGVALLHRRLQKLRLAPNGREAEVPPAREPERDDQLHQQVAGDVVRDGVDVRPHDERDEERRNDRDHRHDDRAPHEALHDRDAEQHHGHELEDVRRDHVRPAHRVVVGVLAAGVQQKVQRRREAQETAEIHVVPARELVVQGNFLLSLNIDFGQPLWHEPFIRITITISLMNGSNPFI